MKIEILPWWLVLLMLLGTLLGSYERTKSVYSVIISLIMALMFITAFVLILRAINKKREERARQFKALLESAHIMFAGLQGVAVDYAKAMKLYGQVAEQTYDLEAAAGAKYGLGYMYEMGFGVPVDYAKAIKLYAEAMDQLYNIENIDEMDNENIFDLVAIATHRLVELLEREAVDYAKAMKLYEQVAERADNWNVDDYGPRVECLAIYAAIAKNHIAFMYLMGLGVPINYAKAMKLYGQVAEQADNLKEAAVAKYCLASMYQLGQGVPIDYEKAMKLYEQVAAQTDNLAAAAIAKYGLGHMYQYGLGVPVDYAAAMELYEQAAAQKDDLYAAVKAKKRLEEIRASQCVENTN